MISRGKADSMIYKIIPLICHQILGRVIIAKLDAKMGAIMKIISATTLIMPRPKASAVLLVDLLRLVRYSAKLRGNQSVVPRVGR